MDQLVSVRTLDGEQNNPETKNTLLYVSLKNSRVTFPVYSKLSVCLEVPDVAIRKHVVRLGYDPKTLTKSGR